MSITTDDIKKELRKELKEREEYQKAKEVVKNYEKNRGMMGPASMLFDQLVEEVRNEDNKS